MGEPGLVGRVTRVAPRPCRGALPRTGLYVLLGLY